MASGPQNEATAGGQAFVRTCRTGRFSVGVVACMMMANAALGQGLEASGGPRSVLFLEWGESGRPAGQEMIRGFRTTLHTDLAEPVAVHTLGLELDRLPGADHEAAIYDYLKVRYGQEPLAAVIAIGDQTVDCVLDWQPSLWPGVPVVAGLVDVELAQRVDAHPEMTGFTVDIDMGGTLDVAMSLLPDTRRVAVAAGSDTLVTLLDRALSARSDVVEVIELVDLSMAETKRRVATLPPDAIVFYAAINRDGAGQAFTPARALEELAPVSNRPVFGFPSTYLGHGIVGGPITDVGEIGSEAARVLLRVLSGEDPASIPVYEADVSRMVFDGRELDRWGLSDSSLPPGSRVLYRGSSMWEDHREAIVAGAAALALQSALIVALLAAVRRRRRAEAQLRGVSGRLLAAQEDERRRVAQELHDDVSQRLALFAIELDELCANTSGAPGEASEQARALGSKARSLSTEVHAIAYELHPAVLDQLGLVPALRQFGEDLATRHGLDIEVAETSWPSDVPRDVELVLYRIIQEALQNAAKHSGSDGVRVHLRGSPGGVSVTVSDTGQGFDVESEVKGQLGLAGMKERLRLVGGELCIDSAARVGTVVAAFVPVARMSSGGWKGGPDSRVRAPRLTRTQW